MSIDLKKLDVAILLFGCDRYQLLFKGFEYFFQKHWDHTIDLPKYVSTEQQEISLESFNYIASGHGAWADRLSNTINQINEQYIIFIQEDMWFSKSISPGILEELLKYSTSQKLPLVKMHSSSHYVIKENKTNINGYVLSTIDKQASNFLMSHQISVWDKNFLLQQLKLKEHPWRNERKGTKRLKKSQAEIYQIDLFSENGNMPNNSNDIDIQYSEYWTVSENAILHPNAKPFILELKLFDLSYANTLEYKMLNKLTHDNKKQPRKQDVFNKIKHAFKKYFSPT